MPTGIDDTWVDGVEAYVLLQEDDLERVAGAFGKPLRWWPRSPDARPDQWWLSSRTAGEAPEDIRKEITAYIAREPDLEWVSLQAGASNGDPWAIDDDYHFPMYEDALAACSLRIPTGPELYETPVRVASRLSRELGTKAIAIWGSDEELALEGICLLDRGQYVWAASAFSVSEIEHITGCYTGALSNESLEDWENERHDEFFLYVPGKAEELIMEPISQWADARARELGAGIFFGVSPHNIYPDDFPAQSEYVAEFMVATGDPASK